MSRTLVLGGGRWCTLSIHCPERSARAARFSGRLTSAGSPPELSLANHDAAPHGGHGQCVRWLKTGRLRGNAPTRSLPRPPVKTTSPHSLEKIPLEKIPSRLVECRGRSTDRGGVLIG